MPQVLMAIGAVLLRFGQIMHDPFTAQMRWQRTTAARLALRRIIAGRCWRVDAGVVFFVRFANHCRITSEFLREQPQLIGT